MTARTLVLRAMAAILAGLACELTYAASADSPIIAMATGQPVLLALAPSEGGIPERQALEAVNPSLSLLPESQLDFPRQLSLGEGDDYMRRGVSTAYNPLILGTRQNFPQIEQYITSQPSLFDRVGDYFITQDIEWPTGTQSSVHIVPVLPNGKNQLIPFIDLLQDADEVDAHLRMGAGAGLKYLINKDMSIDAEVMALESAGYRNPATSSETRFMLMFTMRF